MSDVKPLTFPFFPLHGNLAAVDQCCSTGYRGTGGGAQMGLQALTLPLQRESACIKSGLKLWQFFCILQRTTAVIDLFAVPPHHRSVSKKVRLLVRI